MVIDERIGVVGTHNFDPRGDNYNTESAVVIARRRVRARAGGEHPPRHRAGQCLDDRAAATSRRCFSGLEYSLAKMSERMPIFDLWPVRYATSYEFVPGPGLPAAAAAERPRVSASATAPVGDFPEVNVGLKSLLTRIFTAFGAGLAPIL